MNPRISASKFGFTLVEIIVVISITVLLSGIIIGYSQKSRRLILLSIEKNKIAQTILRAKSLSLSAGIPSLPNHKVCAYGFSIDYQNNTYSVAKYESPPGQDCDEANKPPAGQYNSLAGETYNLIKNLKFGDPNITTDELNDILFFRPGAETVIFADGGDQPYLEDIAKIYLETEDGSNSIMINIGRSGYLSF
jgi:prepilin-type N-terminal cleavage/methylation domain-containing protein